MDDFLKMDVFFVVSTLSVIVLTALIAVALVRVNKILRHIEGLAQRGAEEVGRWQHTVSLARKALDRFMRAPRKRRKEEAE